MMKHNKTLEELQIILGVGRKELVKEKEAVEPEDNH
jgi:hypothetical protein